MDQKLISMTRKSGFSDSSENGESQCAQAVKWLATSFLCMGGIGPRDLAPAPGPGLGLSPTWFNGHCRWPGRAGPGQCHCLCAAGPSQGSLVRSLARWPIWKLWIQLRLKTWRFRVLANQFRWHQPSQTLVISSSESGRSGPPGLACRRGRRRAQAQSESESRLRPADRESEPEPGLAVASLYSRTSEFISARGRVGCKEMTRM